jgi:hypothetical protein
MSMFDALVAFEPEPTDYPAFTRVEEAAPMDLLSAQQASVSWLEQLKVPSDEEIDARRAPPAPTPEEDAELARDVFEKVTSGAPAQQQRNALLQLRAPPAIQHLVGMLTGYDWEFVERAKELRGYAVSKILEETTHPDARIRLKALQMLGNVTEVALFTERVEVTKKDATEAEIEARLRERLLHYTNAIDVTPAAAELPAPADPQAELPALDDEIGQVAERSAD